VTSKDESTDRGHMIALNADVVGYSRLLADDYEATTAAMTEYHGLVDAEVAAHRGTVANFVGDSFMAVFDEVEDAVGCAIAITTAVEARNADVPDSRRVRFRMGLDQGEVGFAAGGYHGDALNIAARIQAIAQPGGISVSGRVYRSLDEPALRFRPVWPVFPPTRAGCPARGRCPSSHRPWRCCRSTPRRSTTGCAAPPP
jgi:class 3 adenylate cyclase